MALLPSEFNSEEHSDMGTFTPHPEGKYNMQIVDSELKLTKAASEAKEKGDPNYANVGQMLVLNFEILDGDLKDSKYTVRLNLVNPKIATVKRAQEELATIQRAMGVQGTITDTEQLHKKPLCVELGIKEGSGSWGPSNNSKGYSKYDWLSSETTSASEPAIASGGKKKPVWEE